jgi:hypothetical protein
MSHVRGQRSIRHRTAILAIAGLVLVAGCSSLSSHAKPPSSTTKPLYAYGTLPKPTPRTLPTHPTPQTGLNAPPVTGYSAPPSPAEQLKKLGYPSDAKYINVSDHSGTTIGVVATGDVLLNVAGSPPYPPGKPGYLVLDLKSHTTVVGYFTHDLGFISVRRDAASIAELRDCLAKRTSHPDCDTVVAQYAAYG